MYLAKRSKNKYMSVKYVLFFFKFVMMMIIIMMTMIMLIMMKKNKNDEVEGENEKCTYLLWRTERRWKRMRRLMIMG